MKTLRLLIPFLALAVATAQPSFQPAPALVLPLREGWTLQSSAKVTATGEAISSASFETKNWIQADVPTTVVAVQVWAPTENNLAITFVDWNPSPPDKNMGLWHEVYLTTSGPVALRHPAVLSRVDSPANSAAHLTVTALLKNASERPVKGTLKGQIENIEFAKPVELAAGESKDVAFAPAPYPQVKLRNPRLWWPAQMGTPNLYELTLSFDVDGSLSDVSHSKFGIRSITSEVSEQAPDRFKRLFKVNGKNILIRGCGWTPDIVLRQTPERFAGEFRYVR